MSGLKSSCCIAAIMVGCMPVMAVAQDSVQGEEEAIGSNDIIVSATRRNVDVSSIPYNISAVGGEQLEATGVTDVASLSQQVPNLNIGSAGGRYLIAQVPIIRGLNASPPTRPQSFSQTPVTAYLGNVASYNFFPIDDVQRVEVLRGPQGTLFGAGSLGGAIRLIPNEPEQGITAGKVSGSLGVVAHSDELDYSIGGMINLPLGETLAFRANAKFQRDAGFIDKVFDVEQQDGPLSAAVPADAGDFANSQSVYKQSEDYNWTDTLSARAALGFDPGTGFEATLAFNYAKIEGEGAPLDNAGFAGGTWTFDSRITTPAVDEWENNYIGREPWERESWMASLDMSYDLGFATISSTTSYLDTQNAAISSGTVNLTQLPDYVLAYYAGSPTFPRFLSQSRYSDSLKDFTQEIRLVSPGGEFIDYTIGGFYQHQKIFDNWEVFTPGINAWAAATGTPFFFPILGDENDRTLNQAGNSKFEQIAGYGELTISPTPELHITGGARVFNMKYKRDWFSDLIGFLDYVEANTSYSKTDVIFKANVSYDFALDNMLYATFSQGFRRGGANGFALAGPFFEPDSLINYQQDTVDNFEVGVKGRFGAGWRYNFDFFYDKWQNPQIDSSTPVWVWPVVVNGEKARTRGIEMELSGPLTDNLDLVFGYAYADGKLTEDFCVPTADGLGGVDPCGISGFSGDRLPGAPKHSGSATLSYEQPVGDNDSIGANLNVNYKGSVLSSLPTATVTPITIDDYFLVNASASYTHGPIKFSVYARNLFDERAVMGYSSRSPEFTQYLIGTPRQLGISASFEF